MLEDANIGRLLHSAMRAYNERALQQIRALGHDRATLAHTAILPHIDEGGTRMTTLAQRIGVTKQAVSLLIKELEAAGYLARKADDTDRRAELVRLTDRGQRFRTDARKVKAAQERELTAALGLSGKHALARLLAAFPWLP